MDYQMIRFSWCDSKAEYKHFQPFLIDESAEWQQIYCHFLAWTLESLVFYINY